MNFKKFLEMLKNYWNHGSFEYQCDSNQENSQDKNIKSTNPKNKSVEILDDSKGPLDSYLGFDKISYDPKEFMRELISYQKDLYDGKEIKIKTSHILFMMKRWPRHSVVNEEGKMF